MRRFVVASAPALTAMLLAGCGRGTSPAQTGPAEVSLNSCTLGKTTAAYGAWRGRLAIVVWTDTAGSAAGGSRTSSKGAAYHGRLAGGGRAVAWQCDTADGKAGPVSIDGAAYDLANGPLFLVTTRGGKTEVRQLQRDWSAVPATAEAIDGLAKEDPDVAAFLAAADPPGK
jgi:hypothetical protein